MLHDLARGWEWTLYLSTNISYIKAVNDPDNKGATVNTFSKKEENEKLIFSLKITLRNHAASTPNGYQ